MTEDEPSANPLSLHLCGGLLTLSNTSTQFGTSYLTKTLPYSGMRSLLRVSKNEVSGCCMGLYWECVYTIPLIYCRTHSDIVPVLAWHFHCCIVGCQTKTGLIHKQ